MENPHQKNYPLGKLPQPEQINYGYVFRNVLVGERRWVGIIRGRRKLFIWEEFFHVHLETHGYS